MVASLSAGALVDCTGKPGLLTSGYLCGAIPLFWLLENKVLLGTESPEHGQTLPAILIITGLGFCVMGPYSLIRTAVAASLGTSPTLNGRKGGVAMMTGVLECAGTVGAMLAGVLGSLNAITLIWLLMGCCLAAFLCLSSIIWKELFTRGSREREIWAKVISTKSLASISFSYAI